MDSSTVGGSADWQFLPYGNNYYLRNSAAGPTFQLGVFSNTNNVNMLALFSADTSSPGQVWSLRAAGAAFGIENVMLGGSVYLDEYSDTLQPFFEAWGHSGQLWTFTSVGPINDVLYSASGVSSTAQASTASSTTTTSVPTLLASLSPTTVSAATSVSAQITASSTAVISAGSPTPSSSSLSIGAIVGIAVGSAIIGLPLAVAFIFLILRRKPSRQMANLPPTEYAGMAEAPGDQALGTLKSEVLRKEGPGRKTSSKPDCLQSTAAELSFPDGNGYVRNSKRHLSELEGK